MIHLAKETCATGCHGYKWDSDICQPCPQHKLIQQLEATEKRQSECDHTEDELGVPYKNFGCRFCQDCGKQLIKEAP